MATLDVSSARMAFSMSDTEVFGFNRIYEADPDFWLFNTPDSHAVRMWGSGLSYDAMGYAQSGLVSRIEIDFLNDNAAAPDIRITGISASAPRLDDGPAEFWHLLQGNDVIYAPDRAKGAALVYVSLSGDGLAAPSGSGRGGHDIFHAGDGGGSFVGDVYSVGSLTPGAPTATYRGGNDQILGLETHVQHLHIGDVSYVHAGSRLFGGDDTILNQSTSISAGATGDANVVVGSSGAMAKLVGGNDDLTGGANFGGWLAGDVSFMRDHSLVRGGADTIRGGELGDLVVGDAYRIEGGTLFGGDDTLFGNGGDDRIFGDGYDIVNYDYIAGGDDVIRGGTGDDILVGDSDKLGANAYGDDRLYGDEGNDRLIGEGGSDELTGGSGNDALQGNAGNDSLFGGSETDQLEGGSGNDLLDGGSGSDRMYGGGGNDVYFVNEDLDRVFEDAGGGHDTIWSSFYARRLLDNIEELRYSGAGSFTGIGNDLNNTIAGGAGNDNLRGGDGNDVLIGGAGADVLHGGAGSDTASYATATAGVEVRLSGSGYGDHAAGDGLSEVENLIGSSFNDALYGDGAANRIVGRAGDDYLQGNGGDDILTGGAGLDILIGGVTGSDTFVFNARNEGRDTIVDFSSGIGNDDRLLFEGDAFGGLAAGALAANRFVANESGVATASGNRFVYETDTGILRFDANGSAAGGVKEIALFSEVPMLTVDDFFIA
jgi:Ca2+-binding RTX toxin-like protein